MSTAAITAEIPGARPFGVPREPARESAIWSEAYAWFALLPTLFITVGGTIVADTTPVAFRFTAMAEDSPGRKLIRFGCSLLMIYLISTRFREMVKAGRKAKLLLLIPAVALVSVVWSQNPSHTLIDAANLTVTTLFALYLYLRYPGHRLVSFLTFAAFASLLLSLFEVVALPGVGIDPLQQGAWRGIFLQRNNCAAVCTLYLVLALHFRTRSFDERIMRGGVLLLSVVFIVMSGSRTGWILAGLALILTFGLRFVARMRSLDRIVVLMAFTIPTVLLASFVANNFTGILAAMDKDPTMTQRTVIWADVLPSIAKQPLHGYGYSSFWMGLNGESMQAVLATGWMEGQAQDGYLDVLLQLGLLGLVPLICLFLRAFGQAARAIQRRSADPLVHVSLVLLPLILVENIGESSFLLPLAIPWFYALIALTALNFTQPAAEAI